MKKFGQEIINILVFCIYTYITNFVFCKVKIYLALKAKLFIISDVEIAHISIMV